MFCTKCGCENNDNARFCQECGAGFEQVQPTAQVPAVQPMQNITGKQKNQKKRIIEIVVLVCLSVLLFSMLTTHKCEWCGEPFMFGGEKIEILGESAWMCDDCLENPFGSFGF